MDRSKEFYIYPEDMYGKKTGHTICVILRDGKMYFGESLCHPEDNFDKRVGREIAKNRAEEVYNKFKDGK